MTPEAAGSQDIRHYLRILWRWKLLFLAFLIVPPIAAYLLEHGKPKTYESSTLISVSNNAPAGVAVTNGTTNITAVARLVTTQAVARGANALLHPPASNLNSLASEVSASGDTTTGFLTISAVDQSPQRAAAIATAFARSLQNYQSDQAVQAIDLQIGALRKQLASIPARDEASRAAVVSQISQLKAQRGSAEAGSQVLQPAAPNFSPVGPKTRRAVEIGLLIGLLLAIGAVLLAENSDRRMRSPEDLESLTGLPLLGVVPPAAFAPGTSDDPRTEEAFQMLRAALMFFNVDRPISSVAIVSPLAGDGKTTVAVGLATAVARSGKRAILVDADVRRAQVCVRLGIEPPPTGLASVLAGESELEDAMFEHHVDAPEGGRLLILPAGQLPPNPTALISSQRMRNLLAELESQCDLVVLDTAAALAVSDALPLLQAASGVSMIVRMNRSAAAAVMRLQKVVTSAHGTVLGVVATGTSSVAAGYGHAYGYYNYSTNSHEANGIRGKLTARLGRGQRRPVQQRSSGRPVAIPRPETNRAGLVPAAPPSLILSTPADSNGVDPDATAQADANA